MTLSLRFAGYLGIAAAGLFGGVLTRRLDLVVLGAPFAMALVVGLVTARPPSITTEVVSAPDRAIEGDELAVTVRIGSPALVDRAELVLELPVGVTRVGDPMAVTIRPAVPREVTMMLRADRWGTHSLGPLIVRARDRAGWWTVLHARPSTHALRVHPRAELVRTLVRTRSTQAASGNQLAVVKGSGVEYADLRPYQSGDRVRDVHWRATARRGELWVAERHPERSTDVVVFLDTFASAAIDRAVRAAITVAQAYLAERDRVGLVSFGGSVSWMRPGTGALQAARMVDHLLGTQVRDSVVWRGVEIVPPGTFPPRSLVVAVTPLEDERGIAALTDLRNRGIDLAIVEVSADGPVTGEPDLVHRVWRLQREVARDRYRRLGVSVAEWTDDRSVESVLAEIRAFRRLGRRVIR